MKARYEVWSDERSETNEHLFSRKAGQAVVVEQDEEMARYLGHQEIMSFMVPDPNVARQVAELLNWYLDPANATPHQLQDLVEKLARVSFYQGMERQL